ncbi:amidohydrolase family protein [Mucilaginibacter terrae]|uniref:Imidazolonepropionase-like amidohydrolase/Tol biopolymer transport system component n=1 Tax=Mucilaginibacter terrae TaxID=1955052 RepID=A0ABU3GZD7_9SPHI|nr:amidohydrolase family protein [Mucilaginibacter terrae]MDT3405135.1 imidazolonepropionase-like amidohydrolase/Tol biopolymer transport system component [Mucilaginibacter terrae]
MKLLLPCILLSAMTLTASAQKWNVENMPGPSKKITITTDEGTWMNVDVSPDGKTIAFDLLGDIYSMPVAGGKATLLSGGKAWEVQPRFSPDGKSIAFTSDRDGGDNIWVMAADGASKHPVTKENFRLLNNPYWTPDGQYFVARKHFTNTRSLGAGELWLYHKNGGEGVQLTQRKNDQQDAGEPVVSPKGTFVYWSEDVTAGPNFQYNKDPNQGIYAIKRLNRNTGQIETVTGGSGGACRPQLSPDGKLMAFVKRNRLKTVLYIHNLHTGEEYPVYDNLNHDQQETWAIFGTYPNFNWTPDNQHLIFYAKGKIWNLDITTLNAVNVPFEVTSQQTITDALHFPQKVFQDEFTVKMIRQLTTSPDGKRVAFNAAGYIYIKELPSGKPERITNTPEFEYEPSFSADGKQLVYTTWNDDLKGAINIIELSTRHITRLTPDRGFYYSPVFSNKGDKVVYRKGEGNETLGYAFGKNPGIYVVPATGGTPVMLLNNGIRPQFGYDDTKLYYQSSEGDKKAYKMIDLANPGVAPKTLYTSTYATQFLPSPDGKWMAFTELFNCYITPMTLTGNAQELSANNKALPLTRLTRDAGTYLHWSKDSQKLMWTLGPKYYTRDIHSAFPFIEGNNDKGANTDTAGIDIGLKLRSYVPAGKIAFTNARIITMKGDEVIEKGTIVVDQNVIMAVGKDVQPPADAKVYNMAGKTIMPGIVDVHGHLGVSPDGISPQQDWHYFANLAYGVTTSHDPSSNTEMVFSQNEMLKAGRMVGPRVYSTGTILYGADGDFKAVINNLDEALSHLRRLKAVGAFSVKSYNQPRREQRQQILEAARQLQMEVVPEGGSTFFTNMSMIADGHTGIEHNIPVWPVYKDVKSFWNASKTAYTPTLIVSYGTQFGENYWYDRSEVWKNEHLLSFTPPAIIDARSRRRTTAEYGDYGHIAVARAVKQIADGGTRVNLGAHGQLQGLGAHWELWMLAQGGFSPLQALRCATINGAAYLGMDKEIGSLEAGKLADLVILNQNPLDDIRNSDNIKYVMVNGRLFDSDSMNEIGNTEKPRLRFWWQLGTGNLMNMPVGNTETYLFGSSDGEQ